MKSLRAVLFVLAVFAAVALLYSLSFASPKDTQADIKLLRDAR